MSARSHRVLSPTAILGYGFPEESFERGMAREPHVVGADAGSSDPGPYYLGAGHSFTSRAGVKRDLAIMLRAARRARIPCIVGSSGGSGARPHLDWTLDIVREIAREERLSFRMAVIAADVPKEEVLRAIRERRIAPAAPAHKLTAADVESCTNLVAQMGMEPFLKALDAGAEVIIAGRSYDPAVFASSAVREGFDKALAVHMGKILECGAIAATPGSGRDCALGELFDDGFVVESLNPKRKFTKVSTAAHTLYEKSDPYHLPGPGGALDLTKARFEEMPGGCVRVSGARHEPSDGYWLKLEGSAPVGWRTISIAGVRDPILIEQIDEVLEAVRKDVLPGGGGDKGDGGGGTRLIFHVYGHNAVMGELEPEKHTRAHELGIVMEAVAPTQDEADAVASQARSTLLHYGYPGRISTAGNLAILMSPADVPAGEVYRFAVYHLMKVDDPCGLFPMHFEEVSP